MGPSSSSTIGSTTLTSYASRASPASSPTSASSATTTSRPRPTSQVPSPPGPKSRRSRARYRYRTVNTASTLVAGRTSRSCPTTSGCLTPAWSCSSGTAC
ncbi:hypothetical protein CGRA01v4_13766 [Colletotrichum graminicola]|nr:hypothetical protein CGRA01v4_13766 [Colletotrichum graminicola]